MSDPRVADMGFRDYLTNVLMLVGDAETAYNRLLDGDDTARDQMANALADAANSIALGCSKGIADAVLLSRAARGEIEPTPTDDADMWEAIQADVDAGLTDPGTLHTAVDDLTEGEREAAARSRACPQVADEGYSGGRAEGELDAVADRWDRALEAFTARAVEEAGDLLASPPEFEPEVPGSLWSETAALEDRHGVYDRDAYRSDHPFPMDPESGEEPKW